MKGEQVREKLAREILRKLRLVRELCGCMLMRRTPTAGCQATELSTALLRRLRKQRRRMIGILYATKCLQTSRRCWTSRRGVRPFPCFCSAFFVSLPQAAVLTNEGLVCKSQLSLHIAIGWQQRSQPFA